MGCGRRVRTDLDAGGDTADRLESLRPSGGHHGVGCRDRVRVPGAQRRYGIGVLSIPDGSAAGDAVRDGLVGRQPLGDGNLADARGEHPEACTRHDLCGRGQV